MADADNKGNQDNAGQPYVDALKKELEEVKAREATQTEKNRLLEETNRYMQAEKDRSATELEDAKKKLENKVELTEEQLEEKKRALSLGLTDKSEVEDLKSELAKLKKSLDEKEVANLAKTLAQQVDELKKEYPFVDEAKIIGRMKNSNVSPREAAQLEYFDEIALSKTKAKPAVPVVEKPTREIELPKGKVPEIGSQAMREVLMNSMFGEE